MCSALVNNVILLSDKVRRLKVPGRRMVVAIAGPPASGKSTLAEELVDHLNSVPSDGVHAALLPMDGFHLDNDILQQKGLLARKGAPETIDANGFCALVRSICHATEDIFFPLFDRALDMAIAGSGVVAREASVVVVEGNYLLLDTDPWNSLLDSFDHTVFISPSIDVLEQRLVQRWLEYGFDEKVAKMRAQQNDLINARLVIQDSVVADTYLGQPVDSIKPACK